MSKAIPIISMGVIMFWSITFVELGFLTIFIEATIMGKLGGIVIIMAGTMMFYASFEMLKSLLIIEELLQEVKA